MLDKDGRIAIGSDLLSKANLKAGENVKIFIDHIQKRLLLLPEKETSYTDFYYVKTHNIDEKNRIYIPKCIREVLPTARYLPVEKDGEIYILIIEK